MTPFWLAVSVAVFLGLGASSFLGGWKIIPLLRNAASIANPTFDIGEKQSIDRLYHGRLARFFFKKVLRVTETRKIIKHPRAFIIYLIPFSIAFLAIADTTLELLTSIGLRSPLSWDGLYYDIVFARSNGLPNGSHIDSYLGVVLIMWVVAIKYRDGMFPNLFLGFLLGFMAVGIHEGLWVPFYYAEYGAHLNFGTLAPNVISDMASVAMYAMFIIGYKLYPHDKPPMRYFLIPALIMLAYLFAWFIVPHFFGYTYFPITTVNNPQFGQTVYNETQYWGNAWVEGTESLSWILIVSMFLVAVFKAKVVKVEG